MTKKNLKSFLKTHSILLILILSINTVFSQKEKSFLEFESFYVNTLDKYKYPEFSIKKFAILNNVNPISFPKISGKVNYDLVIFIHKIKEISDVNEYLIEELRYLKLNKLKTGKDVVNFRLRYIEFILNKKKI